MFGLNKEAEKLLTWGAVGFAGLYLISKFGGKQAYFGGFTRDQYSESGYGNYEAFQGKAMRDQGVTPGTAQPFNCVGCVKTADGMGYDCLQCSAGGQISSPIIGGGGEEHKHGGGGGGQHKQGGGGGGQHQGGGGGGQHQGGGGGGQGPGGGGGHGPGGGGRGPGGGGGQGPGGGGGGRGPGGGGMGPGGGGGGRQGGGQGPGGGGGGQWGPGGGGGGFNPGGYATAKKVSNKPDMPSSGDIGNIIKKQHIGNINKDNYDVAYRPTGPHGGDLDIHDLGPSTHKHTHGPSQAELEQLLQMMMMEGGPPMDTGGGMGPIGGMNMGYGVGYGGSGGGQGGGSGGGMGSEDFW